MKAYKVFNSDWTCKGFQFRVGETFIHGGDIELCESGFHACKKAADCFSYYSFDPANKVAEVELLGDVLGEDQDKQVTNKIRIVRELDWSEVLSLVNSGDGNSGDRNSGDRNSGSWNSGSWNSGSWNSGDGNSGNGNSGSWNSGYKNSGDGNSGNGNSGFFNSVTPNTILVFNKPCQRSVWENAEKPDFINIQINQWVRFGDMTDGEKKKHENAFVCDGYLKTYSYKEAWANAYSKADHKDIKLLKALPNFDADVFEEITGIKVR